MMQKEYDLPFKVEIARDENLLVPIALMRSKAYGERYGPLAAALKKPEPEDTSEHAILFAATREENGEILGSFRIELDCLAEEKFKKINLNDFFPATGRRAFISRLAVIDCPEKTLVRNALFKAMHRFCLAHQIRYMVVAAKPPLDKIYSRLGFDIISPPREFIPIPWAENTKTRLLILDVIKVVKTWIDDKHLLYEFMADQFHPKIKVD